MPVDDAFLLQLERAVSDGVEVQWRRLRARAPHVFHGQQVQDIVTEDLVKSGLCGSAAI